MAIKINREKNERKMVRLYSLAVGDTFLYDNRVGIIASRNGEDFPIELTTGREMRCRTEDPCGPFLGFDTTVLPVEVELSFRVVG
ncbi:MAG: hypothetical protein LIR50_21380 [Bacillota bacterium]|nr:hypothetical protein [Bacillota bacterium]